MDHIVSTQSILVRKKLDFLNKKLTFEKHFDSAPKFAFLTDFQFLYKIPIFEHNSIICPKLDLQNSIIFGKFYFF